MASEPSGSAYAAARDSLRDTVKWLIAAFASIAAVIVAGSPLAKSSDVDPKSPFFWISAGLALVALVCVALALRIAINILRPEGLYASQLSEKVLVDAAVAKARVDIQEHHDDLLPHPLGSADELLDQRSEVLTLLERAQEAKAPNIPQLSELLARLEGHLARLLDFALYRVLYYRLESARLRLFVLGFLTLAVLTVSVAFGMAAKTDATHPTVLLIERNFTPAAPSSVPDPGVPQLEPVRFASLSAEVTPDGVIAIEKARKFLDSNADYTLLLAAHTDTMAGDAINVDLARRRGAAVRAMLLKQGGVAASRVFVSELPESALPRLTSDQVREASNRSVELLAARQAKIDATIR
jgi:outer membrane protein OmpA-like peptidoglycan-associated protein